MPIPNTQEIRKTLLEAFRDEAPHSFSGDEFLELMAEAFNLNLNEMPSNDKNDFKNRINKAKTYLKREKFLSMPSRNVYLITRKGSEALESDFDFMNDETMKEKNEINISSPVTPVADIEEPEIINEVSEQPETEIQEETSSEDFSDEEFNNAPEETVIEEPEEAQKVEEVEETEEQEPVESSDEIIDETDNDDDYDNEESQNIDEAFARYNSELADEVLELVSKIPSDKFEKLVIDLLSKMGYFAFKTSSYSQESDLIQGVIIDHENPGATPIYIHALKSSPEEIISRSNMQEFIKVLVEKSGRGIFATLANFSEQAAAIANNERVILIDGKKLASLMVSNNFCVNVEKVFEVKAIDLDSFNEYEE